MVGLLALTNVSVGNQPVTTLRWSDLQRVVGGECWGNTTLGCDSITKTCVETKCYQDGVYVWVCPASAVEHTQNQTTYTTCTGGAAKGMEDCYFDKNIDCLKVFKCDNAGIAGCKKVGNDWYCIDGKAPGPPLRYEGKHEQWYIDGEVECVTKSK